MIKLHASQASYAASTVYIIFPRDKHPSRTFSDRQQISPGHIIMTVVSRYGALMKFPNISRDTMYTRVHIAFLAIDVRVSRSGLSTNRDNYVEPLNDRIQLTSFYIHNRIADKRSGGREGGGREGGGGVTPRPFKALQLTPIPLRQMPAVVAAFVKALSPAQDFPLSPFAALSLRSLQLPTCALSLPPFLPRSPLAVVRRDFAFIRSGR